MGMSRCPKNSSQNASTGLPSNQETGPPNSGKQPMGWGGVDPLIVICFSQIPWKIASSRNMSALNLLVLNRF